MSIRINESKDGRTMTLTMPEKFDFSAHGEFRKSYEQSSAKSFIIDMRNTSYMDSAALGMLLQLREHTGGQRTAISIKNAGNNVREILEVANFSQLMTLE